LNDTTLYSTGPVRDETGVLGVVGELTGGGGGGGGGELTGGGGGGGKILFGPMDTYIN
jgi:hypothetical protein|tara:strand:- start:42 stop:215 length:174 start_codon:yes stop_codon:yes gene_type:complete